MSAMLLTAPAIEPVPLAEAKAFVRVEHADDDDIISALVAGAPQPVNGFVNLSGLVMAYIAARFGVLGVYVAGRSREKQAAVAGQAVPGVIGDIVRAVVRKK